MEDSKDQKKQPTQVKDRRGTKLKGKNSKTVNHNFFGINSKLYKNLNLIKRPFMDKDQQVILNQPHFIEKESLEPLYVPKSDILEESLKREIAKICYPENLINRVVYDSVTESFYHKQIETKQYQLEVLPFYIPKSVDDDTLIFESRWESGNLRRAIHIHEYEYDLILKPDGSSKGHTQWFYYSVANTRKNKKYTFNIINLIKPDSLYNQGMKILTYSDKAAKEKKIGWYRDGFDICYYQSNMKRKSAGFYYTLTYSIKFKHDYDCVYFAHCYPYTYTRICNFIKNLEKQSVRKNTFRRKNLCETIVGNNCDYLVITNFQSDIEANNRKKGIVMTGRVHPGETSNSHVMESVLDFLTGPSEEAKEMRDNFIFKVVPMLNVDGVVAGMYRCNHAGVDLNRQWSEPSKKNHPTIYFTKQMIKKLKDDRSISFYVDTHNHSRKKNIFLYGCTGKDPYKREQVFPLLMKKFCPVYSYADSVFAVQREKENTARIALWRDFDIINCYTLEMSVCGASKGKYEFYHFNQQILREIAFTLCQSIYELHNIQGAEYKNIIQEIEQTLLNNKDKKEEEMTFNKPIFESDDSADEYNEDQKDLEDFKDKDDEDEFSDSDKIPLNDLLKEDNDNGELLQDQEEFNGDQNGNMME